MVVQLYDTYKKLNAAASKSLSTAHGVLVGKFPLHNVSTNLGIPMRMCPEAAIRLHQIVVHDSKNAEVHVPGVAVFGKGKMKSGFQPVLVRPRRIIDWVRIITEPTWVGLRDAQF